MSDSAACSVPAFRHVKADGSADLAAARKCGASYGGYYLLGYAATGAVVALLSQVARDRAAARFLLAIGVAMFIIGILAAANAGASFETAVKNAKADFEASELEHGAWTTQQSQSAAAWNVAQAASGVGSAVVVGALLLR